MAELNISFRFVNWDKAIEHFETIFRFLVFSSLKNVLLNIKVKREADGTSSKRIA